MLTGVSKPVFDLPRRYSTNKCVTEVLQRREDLEKQESCPTAGGAAKFTTDELVAPVATSQPGGPTAQLVDIH